MPDRRNRSVERDWKSHSAPSRQWIGLSSSRNAGTPLPSFQGRSREAISIGKIRIGAGRRLLPILCRIRDHERGEKSRRCHPVCPDQSRSRRVTRLRQHDRDSGKRL